MKIFDPGVLSDLVLVNLSVMLLIIIPGIGLSYLLQPKKISRSLRISFGFALGFLVPIVLFYLLGLTHLYYSGVWAGVGVMLSGLTIWRFQKIFLEEWKVEKFHWGPWVFYGLIVLYFFLSFVTFHNIGTLDYDTLYSQIGPARYLLEVHAYNPFEMGVLPSLRHELFPGPISFHSVFMLFGVTPWIAVSAAMVVLAPLMVRMMGQFSEQIMKRTEMLTAFLALVTFAGFRLRNGRGTVLALIFLFAFLLLSQIYPELLERKNDSLKKLKLPVFAGSIFVALSLYTNVEIAAALLGVMSVMAFGTWLSGYRNMMKTILASFVGGFILYLPWFSTVVFLVFKDSLAIMFGLYAALIGVSLLFVKLPKLKFSEKKIEWAFLSVLIAAFVMNIIQGHFESVFRLTGYLMWISAACAVVLAGLAFYKPNWKNHLPLISVFMFGLIYFAIYRYLRPLIGSFGLDDSIMYFLFEKDLGSVFPELYAKTQEYFLPQFSIMFVSIFLALLSRLWIWKKWMFTSIMIVFLFISAVRIHENDLDLYSRGQTLGANINMILVIASQMGEDPVWFSKANQEIMAVLDEEAEPGDTVFNMFTAFNPYGSEFSQHYIAYGIATLPLEGKDLVYDDYTTEVLDQIIEEGVDFIVIEVNVNASPEPWLTDSRIEILHASEDYSLILLQVI